MWRSKGVKRKNNNAFKILINTSYLLIFLQVQPHTHQPEKIETGFRSGVGYKTTKE
jgi:hypothetical protein